MKVKTIGLAGPILLSQFSSYLEKSDNYRQYKNFGMGGTQLNLIALELLKRGYKVFIYTLDPRIIHGQETTIYSNELTVHIGRFCTGKIEKFILIKRPTIQYLAQKMLTDRPDLIHAHWTGEYARAAIYSGLKYIISPRDWMPSIFLFQPFRSPASNLLLLFEQLYVLSKSKLNAPNSIYLYNLIKRIFPNKPMEVIPNMMSLPDKCYRANTDKSGVSPILISINNGFTRRKNVKCLLYAFMHVLKSYPEARLLLAGDGYEPNGTAFSWSEKNKLNKNVFFLGVKKNNDLENLIQNSTILVHPSLEESFGNTLIEAMINKTPVIGGIRSGAVPYVLNFGKAGLLVDVKSQRLLAGACIYLLKNETIRNNLAISGYNWAVKNFSTDIIMPKLIDLYNRTIG